jgi:endonuclease G
MKNIRSLAILAAIIFVAFLEDGCVQQFAVSRPAIYSVAQQHRQAGLSPQDQHRVDRNCPFGMPRLNPTVNFGPTQLITRDGYVLQHSASDKIPLWVCEFLETRQLSGHLARGDQFQPDPLLPEGQRAELSDYRGTGYDRGHQAPAGDQTKDARLKAETFYLSNMAPQVPALNQQIWRELEDTVRKWMVERDSGYVITGPMFYDTAEEDPVRARGAITHRVIGKNAVAVPTHFYKIAVSTNSPGHWETIAFVMENRPYKRPYHFEDFIKSVDWVEQRTGIDFMPMLSAQEEKRLEREPSPIWN